MKATIFAAALSLCVISLPLKAANLPISNYPAVNSSQVKIDLNNADVKTLAKSVKGIGQKRAEAIIKYREEHGKFKSLDDLEKVKGFGKQFVKNHLNQLQEVFTIN
ncbi:ComE operon protein 1 [Legionella massiliensis]|uniref:ComE operon protein 1 n=1 Tax=Legionella massiliensis TaxID=1034943 RepID=A0A078L423_9GAMM|nr:helix-hairpin-helix domain-containing protein [Legionella massiliensis]CDZ78874.1 ComE operon protein 1 [Legionella massiliensis]CEE14612.1 ComE operon protein 1 [Legionella massiliensis]